MLFLTCFSVATYSMYCQFCFTFRKWQLHFDFALPVQWLVLSWISFLLDKMTRHILVQYLILGVYVLWQILQIILGPHEKWADFLKRGFESLEALIPFAT